ncbi:hypothetical protein M3A01_23390, partial [Klebsiella pneumoniae]|nr:hypothetical protein [Klebsiella pneumoniae]
SPVWLQKHYGFAPAITLQANSIATIMLCIGCLLAGLGGPLGAALNSVKAVSGSAYRVTIPAVLHIACLRQMLQPPSDTAEIGEKYPARS